MSNPVEGATESPQKQVSRSLVSICESHSKARPKSVDTEIAGNVVTCEFDAEADVPTSPSYRMAAMAAVTRITGRKVTAFIPKHGAGGDVSTETFVLERAQIKH
jgi:hypothetical protein